MAQTGDLARPAGASIAARDGSPGLLSSHDRKLTHDFLKKDGVVAPSDAGIQEDNYGGAIPAEHSAAQIHSAIDPLESNEGLKPGERPNLLKPGELPRPRKQLHEAIVQPFLSQVTALSIKRQHAAGGRALPGSNSPGFAFPPLAAMKAAAPEDVVKFASGLQTAKAAPSAAPPARAPRFPLPGLLQKGTLQHQTNGPNSPRTVFRAITPAAHSGGEGGTGVAGDGGSSNKAQRGQSGPRITGVEGIRKWAKESARELKPESFEKP
jgi:hypothetical protein